MQDTFRISILARAFARVTSLVVLITSGTTLNQRPYFFKENEAKSYNAQLIWKTRLKP